ncbi:hypothetical protein B9Z39_04970 [Limnohabitans sp. JirII-29]|uniref:hypothetical protein n=1 Tax=Limnohabitans sp. JirII-29 TaxID=1835756 RepID=UPI000D3BBABF|nr:hypothetical protein [Limnohabitans sp. JirII-29]PUE29421.1 hypothetical protein B9Z39_04970 [Limnohabitans sp. JirII-29]
MKTATLPPIRVAPDFRLELEAKLVNAKKIKARRITYRVLFSKAVAEDLEQLFDFALQRELNSATGDLNIADKAVQAIKDGIAFLTTSPFACRKVGASSFVRELTN